MLSATTPNGNGWTGGTYARTSGNPPNAGGTFSGVGAANVPGSQIGTPQIATARNNRGTNIRIPYARLVPLRGTAQEDSLFVKGRPLVHEYDGLEAGEVAWIMGRKMYNPSAAAGIASMNAGSGEFGVGRKRPGGSDLDVDGDRGNALLVPGAEYPGVASRSAHALGVGYGPDRMQRLASTDWIEALFRNGLNGMNNMRVGDVAANVNSPADGTIIDLAHLYLGGPGVTDLQQGFSFPTLLDSELAYFSKFVQHGNAIQAPDVAWMAAKAFGGNVKAIGGADGHELKSVGFVSDPTTFKNDPVRLLHVAAAYAAKAAAEEADKLGVSGGSQGKIMRAAAPRAIGYRDEEHLARVMGYENFQKLCKGEQWEIGGYPDREPKDKPERAWSGMMGYQQQGIFVMERGPFLRGKPASDEMCSINVFPVKDKYGVERRSLEVPRSFGSQLAFSALEADMRRRGFFEWTPDGVVLSKFDTGPNAQADAEIEARMAQLFNVAVQGQAITTTWVGDSKMEVLPEDKVFIVLVADLVYHLEDNTTGVRANAEARHSRATTNLMHAHAKAVIDGEAAKIDDYKKRLTPENGATDEMLTSETWNDPNQYSAAHQVRARTDTHVNTGVTNTLGAYKPSGAGPFGVASSAFAQDTHKESGENIIKDYMMSVKGVREKERGSVDSAVQTAEGLRKTAQEKMDELKSHIDWSDGDQVKAWEYLAQQVRTGQKSVEQANLRNFRLMKVTSSYLQQFSHHDPKRAGSRCGLKISASSIDSSEGPGNKWTKPSDTEGAQNAKKELDKARTALAEVMAASVSTSGPPQPTSDDTTKKQTTYPDNGMKKRAELRARYLVTVREREYVRYMTTVGTGSAQGITRGVAEYIIGGWCIGTVLDSAASRSTVSNQQVRNAPMSMALNVNVNVEWWSGDKLYHNFMDVDGLVVHRNQAQNPRMGQPVDMDPYTALSTPDPDQYWHAYGTYDSPVSWGSLDSVTNVGASYNIKEALAADYSLIANPTAEEVKDADGGQGASFLSYGDLRSFPVAMPFGIPSTILLGAVDKFPDFSPLYPDPGIKMEVVRGSDDYGAEVETPWKDKPQPHRIAQRPVDQFGRALPRPANRTKQYGAVYDTGKARGESSQILSYPLSPSTAF